MQFFPYAIRIFLACVAASVALLTSANAGAGFTRGQLDPLYVKVAEGDQSALETLKAEAQKGAPSAQYTLGFLYLGGVGVKQDDREGLRWYREAAGQGHAEAQYELGLLYDGSRHVARDYSQAAQWYRKAAEQGHPAAQVELASYYENGRGVARDRRQAMHWLRKAAEGVVHNDPADWNLIALNQLADLYAKGRGVPKNKVAAYALYTVSTHVDQTGENFASQALPSLARGMKAQEIAAGQALADKIRASGNLLKALDEYLVAQASDSVRAKASLGHGTK